MKETQHENGKILTIVVFICTIIIIAIVAILVRKFSKDSKYVC